MLQSYNKFLTYPSFLAIILKILLDRYSQGREKLRKLFLNKATTISINGDRGVGF
jgi:hypothetical protein